MEIPKPDVRAVLNHRARRDREQDIDMRRRVHPELPTSLNQIGLLATCDTAKAQGLLTC
jgi:hypothetical protein